MGLQGRATLTIFSDKNNEVDNGLGHAGVIYKDANGNETTYALWPDKHELVGSNGDQSDVRVNVKGGMIDVGLGHLAWVDGDTAACGGEVYAYRREVQLSPDQERAFLDFVSTPAEWGHLHNCSSWASDAFYAATGEDIDADTWIGIETPGELGSSIVAANGGRASNDNRGGSAKGSSGASSNGRDTMAGTSVGSLAVGGSMVGAGSLGAASSAAVASGSALGSSGAVGLRIK